MVEYSNVNTHKEYHVGHLRNVCYGDTVHRILSANGFDSIPVSYINDFGIHVAKTIWAYREFYKKKEPGKNKGEFLGQVYVRAVSELERNDTAKRMVEGIMKQIERRTGQEYDLWQETRQWSIDQFNSIYRELDINFDQVFYESEFIDQGRKEVEKLVKKGVFRVSQGAVIADLEQDKLGVLVVLRSDGTATYPVADIPLTRHKFKKFDLDQAIWVVDVRQSLYFKQLFKIMEHLGVDKEMTHLGFEFVKLPSGMISSRKGNVVTLEELKQEMLKKAVKETKKRHSDWKKEKINTVAARIAVGAMKFEMIKVGANQEITFDIDKALEFTGYTAAYLQYTYARINSILHKADNRKQITAKDYLKLSEEKEHALILKLAKYPEAVGRAGREYNPSEIAKYLFELAQSFNDYYHSIPVLKAEEKVKQARLMLIGSVNQVIKNGLELLGIDVLEEM
jgi:arginyl-tRNA synthetase